ncbi:MAG: hypothetical protein ACRC8P_01965 [Spiroplasma sp.]
MSINEIIKKYLPVEKSKLSYANKQYNYCLAYTYQNCTACKEVKRIKCCKKLIYQSAKQVSSSKWHLFFLCLNNHLVIRWVRFDEVIVVAGQIKN